MAVAIFSLYSVHLLLKTANEGGESSAVAARPPARRRSVLRCRSCLFKARGCTSSSATRPSGFRANWRRPAPSPCRTSEVSGVTQPQRVLYLPAPKKEGKGGGTNAGVWDPACLGMSETRVTRVTSIRHTSWFKFPTWAGLGFHRVLTSFLLLLLAAMSTYLYIIKYELPTVIKAFLGTNE